MNRQQRRQGWKQLLWIVGGVWLLLLTTVVDLFTRSENRSTQPATERRALQEEERVYQANVEYWKATFEYFKTFATICLASIAAYSALLVGLFSEPHDVAASMIGPICSGKLLPLCRFGNQSAIVRAIPFAAFTLAGLSSLAGAHNCRNALWDSRDVTNEAQFHNMRRHTFVTWCRWAVRLSYMTATLVFFVIVALSIEPN